MNNKGASIFVVFMFAMLLFAFGLAIASGLNSAVQSVRTTWGCTTNFTTMDYGNQVGCTVSDLYSPLFVAIIFGIAGSLIAIKIGGA
ncbi:MAG: hypothetical protein ABSG05_03495 [Candidatus Pacearchaeota archaeon]|jgi:hypothetical protein